MGLVLGVSFLNSPTVYVTFPFTYFFSSIVAFITEELHRNFTEIEPRALNILTDLA